MGQVPCAAQHIRGALCEASCGYFEVRTTASSSTPNIYALCGTVKGVRWAEGGFGAASLRKGSCGMSEWPAGVHCGVPWPERLCNRPFWRLLLRAQEHCLGPITWMAARAYRRMRPGQRCPQVLNALSLLRGMHTCAFALPPASQSVPFCSMHWVVQLQ